MDVQPDAVAEGVVAVSETKYPVTPTLSVADMEMVFNGELVDDAPRFIMKLDAVLFIGAVVSEVVPPPPVVSLPPPPPHADNPTKTVKQTTAHILLFIKMPPPLQIGISFYGSAPFFDSYTPHLRIWMRQIRVAGFKLAFVRSHHFAVVEVARTERFFCTPWKKDA